MQQCGTEVCFKKLWLIHIPRQDPAIVLSGETLADQDSIEEDVDRPVTCSDIKQIMPTVIILIITLFVMVTVIPYAFSSVIKQVLGVMAMEEQSKKKI